MNRFLTIIGFILLASVGSSGAGAAEFDPAHLPADACWLVHVDVEAMRSTELGKALSQSWLSRGAVRAKLKLVRRAIGIDPSEDLLSVTAYDKRFAQHSGVLVIRTDNLKPQELLAKVKEKAPDHISDQYGDRTLITWTADKDSPQQHKITGCIYDARTIIFSRAPNDVKAAVDLLAGRGRAMPADSPLAAAAPKGNVLTIRGVGMADQATPFQSQVIRQAEMLEILAGQSDEAAYVRAKLIATSPQVAQNCRAFIDGCWRAAQRQAQSDPVALSVLSGVSVTVSDRTVSAQWEFATEDIPRLLEKIAENGASQRKNGHNRANKPTASPSKASKRNGEQPPDE